MALLFVLFSTPGGSIPLQGLLDFLLTLRGTALSPEATPFSILMAMECAPPSATAPNAPKASMSAVEVKDEPLPEPPSEGGEDATTGDIHPPAATAAASLPEGPVHNPKDYDLTCVEMRIDFHDCLELICRVACSPSNLWTLAAAPSAAGSGGLVLPAQGRSSRSGAAEGDEDSVSVYSVNLADLLSERIGLWKQTFDVDGLSA